MVHEGISLSILVTERVELVRQRVQKILCNILPIWEPGGCPGFDFNKLLDAYGIAKTVGNTNSSCSGRFVEVKEYHTTIKAMDVVGISLDQQAAIFCVVVLILRLGNNYFNKGTQPDSFRPKYC